MLGFAEEDFCLCSQWEEKHYDLGIGEGNMCFIFGGIWISPDGCGHCF